MRRLLAARRCGQRAWGRPSTPGRVLLLTPSHGRGGGIERYAATLEWALATRGIACQRIDLTEAGVRAHLAMMECALAMLREIEEPTLLVVGHRALLPVAALIAREPTVCGMSVLCHGSEVWDAHLRPRRSIERHLMRHPCVRVIAVSSYTAGTLAAECHATVLPPALSQEWFATLVDVATTATGTAPGIQVVTVFRLASWREKGLPELIAALAALSRPDVRLTVCGSGRPPADLLQLGANHSWCTLRTGLTDRELAHQLATADLFVLATRTRQGRHASGEGFGIVLVEAQIAGTAVIAPAHGGSSDAYVEGVTGVAPADETTEALTRLLGEILKDPVKMGWMGKRAAEWARESFAPERYAQLVVRRLL